MRCNRNTGADHSDQQRALDDEIQRLPEPVGAWLDEHAGRQDANARHSMETAKLVTTFAAAIAATFVATALVYRGSWRMATSVVMALALLAVMRVLLARPGDNAAELDKIAQVASEGRCTADDTLRQLRAARRSTAKTNSAAAERIRYWMLAQVVLSGLASLLAAISIFVSAPPPQ